MPGCYQFKTAVGKFEGVEEALTRIGANAWLCDAARVMTAGAIDLAKALGGVRYRQVSRHRTWPASRSMTVWTLSAARAFAWARNLGRAYQQVPRITVEVPSIPTRSSISSGRGDSPPPVCAEGNGRGPAAT